MLAVDYTTIIVMVIMILLLLAGLILGIIGIVKKSKPFGFIGLILFIIGLLYIVTWIVRLILGFSAW